MTISRKKRIWERWQKRRRRRNKKKLCSKKRMIIMNKKNWLLMYKNSPTQMGKTFKLIAIICQLIERIRWNRKRGSRGCRLWNRFLRKWIWKLDSKQHLILENMIHMKITNTLIINPQKTHLKTIKSTKDKSKNTMTNSQSHRKKKFKIKRSSWVCKSHIAMMLRKSLRWIMMIAGSWRNSKIKSLLTSNDLNLRFKKSKMSMGITLRNLMPPVIVKNPKNHLRSKLTRRNLYQRNKFVKNK